MDKKRNTVLDGSFYAILFSIYPSLALLATNVEEVSAVTAIRPMIVSVLFTFAISMVLFWFFKIWAKAFPGAVIVVFLFFSHGHIIRFMAERYQTVRTEAWTSIISSLYVVFLLASLYWSWKTEEDLSKWTPTLSLIAIILVLFPLSKAALSSFSQYREAAPVSPSTAIGLQQQPANTLDTPGNLPDIYYILLDGYGRADTLKELGYDNSPFLSSLEQMGFYVAQCSASNYRSTLLSMPSILNMDYLHNFLPKPNSDNESTIPLLSGYLIHNRVRTELEKMGYTTISFETGYRWNEWKDADLYLTPNDDSVISVLTAPFLTQFEYIFLSNTVLADNIKSSKIGTTRYNDLYTRVNFTLDELPTVVNLPGPKFVYAHVLTPHYPFIFLPDGSLNTDSRYYTTERGTPDDEGLTRIGYINNIEFLNSRLPDIIRSILDNSASPPIIIIQGDHGHVIPERRFNNLNAFYLPNDGNSLLYPGITSVNTFRVVFNKYFGTDFELLKDTSYDSHIGNPYLQTIVKPFPKTCP